MFWKAVQHHAMLLVVLPLVTIVIALFFAFLLNVGGGPGGVRRGLGVEVLPGGVLPPPGPRRRRRRRCSSSGCTGPTSSGMINGLLMTVGAEPGRAS